MKGAEGVLNVLINVFEFLVKNGVYASTEMLKAGPKGIFDFITSVFVRTLTSIRFFCHAFFEIDDENGKWTLGIIPKKIINAFTKSFNGTYKYPEVKDIAWFTYKDPTSGIVETDKEPLIEPVKKADKPSKARIIAANIARVVASPILFLISKSARDVYGVVLLALALAAIIIPFMPINMAVGLLVALFATVLVGNIYAVCKQAHYAQKDKLAINNIRLKGEIIEYALNNSMDVESLLNKTNSQNPTERGLANSKAKFFEKPTLWQGFKRAAKLWLVADIIAVGIVVTDKIINSVLNPIWAALTAFDLFNGYAFGAKAFFGGLDSVKKTYNAEFEAIKAMIKQNPRYSGFDDTQLDNLASNLINTKKKDLLNNLSYNVSGTGVDSLKEKIYTKWDKVAIFFKEVVRAFFYDNLFEFLFKGAAAAKTVHCTIHDIKETQTLDSKVSEYIDSKIYTKNAKKFATAVSTGRSNTDGQHIDNVGFDASVGVGVW